MSVQALMAMPLPKDGERLGKREGETALGPPAIVLDGWEQLGGYFP